MLSVTVTRSGPIFNGRSAAIIQDMLDDAVVDIADEGGDYIRASTSVFKAPTGYWESQVDVQEFPGEARVVNETIYTRWLEGVSFKNDRSRFKGYRLFQAARGWLDRTAHQIATAAVARHIHRLN